MKGVTLSDVTKMTNKISRFIKQVAVAAFSHLIKHCLSTYHHTVAAHFNIIHKYSDNHGTQVQGKSLTSIRP